MRSTFLVAVYICCLLRYAGADEFPTIDIIDLDVPGSPLQNSPKLFPKTINNDIKITLTPATVRVRIHLSTCSFQSQSPPLTGAAKIIILDTTLYTFCFFLQCKDANGTLLFQFNAPLYRDDTSGTIHLFGPTVLVKRAQDLFITLRNNMSQYHSSSSLEFETGDTNLHSHGLKDGLGVRSQFDAENYESGDNVFIHVPAKPDSNATPAEMQFKTRVFDNHLPGLHWYHPHKHGSSTSQVFTANGLILVEDDPMWLPDANGCNEIWSLLSSAPDLMLHFALLTFGLHKAAMRNQLDGIPLNRFADANYQIVTEEGNSTLCCNTTTNGITRTAGMLQGSLSNSDIALINMIYQPTIFMKSGEWQQWRMLHSGYKRFMDLQIFDNNGSITKECDIALIAKDGVYLMEIPRMVTNIFLTSGSRAEILIRCNGLVGSRYTIQSGRQPPDINFSFGSPPTLFLSHNQSVVATIEIESGGTPGPDLTPRKCTPLRPNYAADLRDEARIKANALDKIYYEPRATFGGNRVGCNIGGQNFTFPDPEPLLMPLGKVSEWRVYGQSGHPIHHHVGPYQIASLPEDLLFPNCSYTSYFEAGDFHDTLLTPMASFY